VRIARVQHEDSAAPLLALACDGAYYDVAVLEELFGGGSGYPVDFHGRVVAMRCAGLDAIDARLASGVRPTEARLAPASYLPLPPCDVARAAYVQLGPPEVDGGLRYQHRDCRALVGDGQPVSFPHGSERPHIEVGLAALMAEDLSRAGAEEAERAVLGLTLLVDWTMHARRWPDAPSGPDAASQLGPEIAVGPEGRALARAPLRVALAGGASHEARWPSAAPSPAEALARLSHFVELRAGDVVGLGALAALELGFGARVEVSAESLRLRGWAARGPEPGPWRRR
jgi:hypothetical protein